MTSQNLEGLVNVAPFSFFNVASSNPPLLSISFTGNKDSLNNLLTTKEAVVHLVNEDNVELMNQTAAPLAEHISEAEEFSLELVPSQKVQVPSLKESNVRLETKLYHHLPLGESGHLVLLEVVNFSFAEELLDEENFHVNLNKLKPVGRLAGDDYSTLGNRFSLLRPR
ncbi:flavin reductase family protein [Lactococcus lactis]